LFVLTVIVKLLPLLFVFDPELAGAVSMLRFDKSLFPPSLVFSFSFVYMFVEVVLGAFESLVERFRGLMVDDSFDFYFIFYVRSLSQIN
jgi:hypothetical protein